MVNKKAKQGIYKNADYSYSVGCQKYHRMQARGLQAVPAAISAGQ